MAQYSEMNGEYMKVLAHANPPVRACVEAPLPAETPVLLEALAFRPRPRPPSAPGADGAPPGPAKFTMHVQSVSHWAPANIGPYSQAVRVGDIMYVAGQIPLVPGTMQLVSGGARKQCRLALRHVGRIVRAVDANTQLRDVVQGICYVTHPSYIPEARREWEKRTNNAIVDYVVVPHLPRGALLEWHIWAHQHNNRFEYEETGCCIGDFRVSIRRRWNYENNVSAVVCYVSSVGTGSLLTGLESGDGQTRSSNETTPALTPQPPEEMSDEHLSEVICYTLAKLLRKADAATVCNIRFFYKVGVAPNPERINSVLAHAEGFNIVHSIIPVCQLHNAHTFLSICGVRHK
ncbi:Uncharacterized protein GBIM_14654 [Gryllus bimaculatus]|nr:Uncharacterized protein GBIM_14654 [Gryllus bimaculatus]